MIDIILFLIANVVNVLVTAIFLARARKLAKTEHLLGIAVVAMAIPVTACVIVHFVRQEEWWRIVLPLPLLAYLTVETVFDYILKLNFRNTNLRWPYIFLYYLGLLAMIGYSFLIGRAYGFVTLATYFLNLAATWYAHAKTGKV